jgi:hypothetical protein
VVASSRPASPPPRACRRRASSLRPGSWRPCRRNRRRCCRGRSASAARSTIRPTVLASSRAVDEARIDEAAVMLEGVVARVIDAAARPPRHIRCSARARPDAAGSSNSRSPSPAPDREVLVGSAAILALPCLIALASGSSRRPASRRAAAGRRHAGFGIDHVGGDLVDQMLEVVAAAGLRKPRSLVSELM